MQHNLNSKSKRDLPPKKQLLQNQKNFQKQPVISPKTENIVNYDRLGLKSKLSTKDQATCCKSSLNK